MLTLDPNNALDNSRDVARILSGIEKTYLVLKGFLGKLGTVIVAVVLGLPFIFLLSFILRRQRKILLKYMKDDATVNTVEDYLSLKAMLAKMEAMEPKFANVMNYDMKNTAWLLRYPLRQIQKTAGTLFLVHEWGKKKLDQFNTPRHTDRTGNFKFISEQELWKERNNAYEYWL